MKISSRPKGSIDQSKTSTLNWLGLSICWSYTWRKAITKQPRLSRNSFSHPPTWENWRKSLSRNTSRRKIILGWHSWSRKRSKTRWRSSKICKIKARFSIITGFKVFRSCMTSSGTWPHARPDSTTTKKPSICSTAPRIGNWSAKEKAQAWP